MSRVCPICHGPACDNPFSCLLNSDHNFLADETIEGENKRIEETKKYRDKWAIKIG